MKKISQKEKWALSAILCAAVFVSAIETVAFDTAYAQGVGAMPATQARIMYMPPPPKPYCVLTAYPVETEVGTALTVVWVTSRASSIKISGIGGVGATGSVVVLPQRTTTYTLTAGAYGSSACTSTVRVTVN